MMKYRIHPAAEQEAEHAAEWYGEQVPSLAIEFARQLWPLIGSSNLPGCILWLKMGLKESNAVTSAISAAFRTGSSTRSLEKKSSSQPLPIIASGPGTGCTV